MSHNLEIVIINVIVVIAAFIVKEVISVLLLLGVLLRALLIDSVGIKSKETFRIDCLNASNAEKHGYRLLVGN